MTASDTLADLVRVYEGSDGQATMALYQRLDQFGPAGTLAVNLFRAHKTSGRAKVYSRRYRGAAYDRKQWSIGNLVDVLGQHAGSLGIVRGWGVDAATIGYPHVLYIDMPTGQISFHSPVRGPGADYAGEWDGAVGVGADRILRWIARLLDQKSAATGDEKLPQLIWAPGRKPCGECHLRPGEECDICGAIASLAQEERAQT
jgi:hypothetical protein